VAAVGPGRALAGEAGALALAALMIAAIRTTFEHRSDDAVEGSSIREGVRFIVGNRGIATYTVIAIAVYFVGAGSYALLVPLLRDGVGLESGAVGTILAIGSLASLAASVLAAGVTRRFGGAIVMSACLLTAPIATALLGLVGAFVTALVAVFVYELIEGLISVVAIAERQRRAPERLQARVGIAGRMILLGSMASGAAIASALTSSIGIAHLYLAMGAATMLVGVCACPFLLRLDD
jgi:predicted MFS family arabinose efflux permease